MSVPPTDANGARPLAAVCLAVSMLMVDLTVVVVALPDIQRW